jgi:hypothetical protein
MNNRQISERAGVDEDVYTWNEIQLERFAELVRHDEREACAKLCEQTDIVQYISGIHTRDDASGTLDKAAKAIRARGNT